MVGFVKLFLNVVFRDRLSGKEHSVFTGVAIIHCSSKGTWVILLKLSILMSNYLHKDLYR